MNEFGANSSCDISMNTRLKHSGYPIMTWMDVAPAFVDLHLLTTNGDGKGADWGFFHEMGHNHQVGDWTFHGAGEVTNNIFALFLIDKMCHQTSDAHSALAPATMRKNLAKYFAGGARYDQWKADPFLALETFVLVQKGFGWDAFRIHRSRRGPSPPCPSERGSPFCRSTSSHRDRERRMITTSTHLCHRAFRHEWKGSQNFRHDDLGTSGAITVAK